MDLEDGDLIVARITSQIANGKFDFKIKNWGKCGLLLPSVIRLNKIATLEKSLVYRKLGILNESEILEVKKQFKAICEEI